MHSALADPARRRECIACEPSSLLAQWELLEVFLEHLPSHFPNLYTVRGEGDDRTVEVHPTGDVYRVGGAESNCRGRAWRCDGEGRCLAHDVPWPC
jgi:hypothetical protein